MYPTRTAGADYTVAWREVDRIREAVLRALARPGTLGGAALGCLLATTSAGLLAGLLSALACWFGLGILSLYWQGEAALPGPGPTPLSLPGPASGSETSAPLPESLRQRYRDLHLRVGRLVAALPEGLPVAARELEQLPERFRALARRRAPLAQDLPAAVGLDAELDRIEALVTRVEELAGRGDPGREVALVLDELEAVLEVAEDSSFEA